MPPPTKILSPDSAPGVGSLQLLLTGGRLEEVAGPAQASTVEREAQSRREGPDDRATGVKDALQSLGDPSGHNHVG